MIKILLFAHLQEEIGQASIEIDRAELTVAELKQWVTEAYTVSNLDQVMVAVNENYASDTDIISTGSTVALIPPVSGG
ncbi:molybdopterin converting factor subunit 1 [Radiobacillus sp. PE A8.2]|uniref:molybdopterin converting factor subunit 1 n=1 Tax=Radiobacillus sp. PE A8.2 TaxID=3380349 RepID=UPI00388F38B4